MRTKLSVCRRKRDYATAQAALDEARRIGLPLRPYACDRCGRYHLTGRTKGKWLPGGRGTPPAFAPQPADAQPSRSNSTTPATIRADVLRRPIRSPDPAE